MEGTAASMAVDKVDSPDSVDSFDGEDRVDSVDSVAEGDMTTGGRRASGTLQNRATVAGLGCLAPLAIDKPRRKRVNQAETGGKRRKRRKRRNGKEETNGRLCPVDV